ncbi:hypothetical protein LR48_Vigan05g112800 [Vigna angularis]|uniref:Exonuclease domain-containing protein n=1 Tax=Phaseolus angularis TaxID=3914 RepID=A0A0L9ULU4_PHAAN|nr:hypothetical protein LR48_Vigan05g112800 [Vigna angularis]
MKKPKQTQLNPNWLQLQQKLNDSKASRTFKNSDKVTPESILGKRKERPDEESNDSQINPLTPVNDDSSLTDAVAMDCEMVGVGQGNKSALGRVTLVNKWGNVIYDEFVRPMERVVDFRTKISGIRPRDLRKVPLFSTWCQEPNKKGTLIYAFPTGLLLIGTLDGTMLNYLGRISALHDFNELLPLDVTPGNWRIVLSFSIYYFIWLTCKVPLGLGLDFRISSCCLVFA